MTAGACCHVASGAGHRSGGFEAGFTDLLTKMTLPGGAGAAQGSCGGGSESG